MDTPRRANIRKASSIITAKLVDMAREPIIDLLKKEVLRTKGLKEQVALLLSEIYCSEFEIIDGLKQHPKGLTFSQWCLLREVTS